MRSHRSSGSGRSHSSTSSRMRRSSTRSRHSTTVSHSRIGGHHCRSHTTIFVGGGHSTTIKGGLKTLMSVFIFISLIVAITGFIMHTTNSDYQKEISYSYSYYQNLIIEAEENDDDLIHEGIVVGRYIGYGDKWYITYKVDNHIYDSFSVYNDEQIKDIKIGDDIDIACDSKYITTTTDTIPVDYKNFSLEDDGEYIETKAGKTNGIILIIVGISFTLLFICLTVVVGKKQNAKEQETANVNESSSNQTPLQITKICMYCGQRLDNEKNKCPHCGAPQK